MQLLTIMAMTATEDLSTMSCGGLVDPETAAAEPVVLWTDPESIVSMERASAAERSRSPGSAVA